MALVANRLQDDEIAAKIFQKHGGVLTASQLVEFLVDEAAMCPVDARNYVWRLLESGVVDWGWDHKLRLHAAA